MSPRALAAPVLAATAAALALGWGFIGSSSPTFDEPVHLAAGWTDLAHGRYRLNSKDHPPLAEMWAAAALAPLRPNSFLSHPDWVSARPYHFADLFLYGNRAPAGDMLAAARRWNLATLSLLLAAALAAWAARLGGAPAAWCAAGALAGCVPWASNAALVTTDAMPAALFFAACAVLAAPARTHARWAAAGALAGAALASKFSMILLPPLAACALLAERRRAEPLGWAAAAAACVLVLAASYRFARLPLWFEGLAATAARLAEGRASYLAGMHSTDGWWWYFPAAIALKTPLPLLGLGAAGAALALRRPAGERAWLLLPPLGFLLAALPSRTQIGYRHVLPFYPFLCLWAGLAGARLWSAGRGGRAALAALAAWLALSAAGARTAPLAYFNELVPRGRGGDWLADSNLDWGQDLPTLAAELRARGNPPVVLSYFGSADPAAYGIRYVPLGVHSLVARPGNAALAPGGPALLAVSATNLAAVYFKDKAAFSWLKGRSPAAAPGGSILLFDLSGDAAARARAAELLRADGRDHDARALMMLH